jgi:hypothetical protein
MADERNPATDDRAASDQVPPSPAGGAPRGAAEDADQHTSTFDPFADDDDDDDGAAGRPGDDATVAVPAGGDATRAMPAADDATRAMPADEGATQAVPADGDATQRVAPHIWAARVHVPPADVAPAPQPATQWPEGYGEPGYGGGERSWLRPAVIALVVLILLAMLGTGLWLIFNRTDTRQAPVPAIPAPASGNATPSATATVSATPTQTATGTPTASPTSQATATPTPTPTAAAAVAVPNLVGQTEAEAKRQLTAKGLTYQVTRRTTTGAPAGTVIATEPGSGSMVAKGTQVILTVAQAPASPSAAASPSAGG